MMMRREPWVLRAVAAAERVFDRARDLRRAGKPVRSVALLLVVIAVSAALWLTAALMLSIGRE